MFGLVDFVVKNVTSAHSARSRQARLATGRRPTSRLDDLARLDAASADCHALRVALAVRRADGLEVRKEAALRDAGRVETDAALVLRRTLADDDIADRRPLAADFTDS